MKPGLVRRAVGAIGWTIFVLFLPIALLAIFHPPNEYEVTLGIDALDCNGPFETYSVAVPALIVYGAGFVINVFRWRRLASLMVAIGCLAICLGVAGNVARAMAEERDQAAACAVQ